MPASSCFSTSHAEDFSVCSMSWNLDFSGLVAGLLNLLPGGF